MGEPFHTPAASPASGYSAGDPLNLASPGSCIGARLIDLIVGLRVARSDDGAHPPGWGKAALRGSNRLVGLVPGLGGFIVLLVALVSLIMLLVTTRTEPSWIVLPQRLLSRSRPVGLCR